MSTAFLSNTKYASYAERNFVSAYLRQLFDDYEIPLVPDLIISLCLAYFMRFGYFMKGNKEFQYDNHETTITNIERSRWWSLCLGDCCINSMERYIVSWTIKINKCTKYSSGIVIGVVSKDVKYTSEQIKYEAYNSGSLISYNHQQTNDQREGPKFGAKDNVKLTLDLCKKQIKMNVNYKKDTLLFENVICKRDIDYRLCVKLYHQSDSISIVSSSIHRE